MKQERGYKAEVNIFELVGGFVSFHSSPHADVFSIKMTADRLVSLLHATNGKQRKTKQMYVNLNRPVGSLVFVSHLLLHINTQPIFSENNFFMGRKQRGCLDTPSCGFILLTFLFFECMITQKN